MGIGKLIGGAADAAKRAAEAAAKRAAEAARRAAEAAARKAAEAAEQAAAKAQEAKEKVSNAAQERARDVFEGAKDKAGDAVGGVANATKNVVGGVANATQNVVEGAKDKAGDAVGGVANATKNVVGGVANATQNVVEGTKDRVQDAAGNVRNAAGDVFEAGRTATQRTLSATGTAAAVTANGLGNVLKDAAERAGPVLDKATDIAADGLDVAGRAIQDAPTLNPLQGITNDIIGGALQGTADVVRDPVDTARAIGDAVNLNRQVDQLKPGESTSISLYAEANGATLAGKVKGTLGVSRSEEEGGGYTVSVTGEVGAGVAAKLGAKGAADAGAEAFGTAGATVEFKFDTAEEAKNATRIIAASTATAGATASNPVLGAGVNHVLGDPLSDLAGLTKNMSAVEFKLGAEASVNAELGMKGLPEAISAGAGASAGVNQSTTARIEMEGGKPQKLTLKQSLEINANASASAGVGIPTGGGDSVSLPTNASAGVSGSLGVELEQSVELPEGFNPTDFIKDPKGTAREIGASVRDTHEAKLTLTDSRQANASALGLGGATGREVKAEISGNINDIATSGAFGSIARGDVGQALNQLKDKVEIKATVQDKHKVTGDFGVGVHAGVGGGEVGLSTERTYAGESQDLNAAQLAELYLTQRWSAGIPG
ncbi:hypothetical protein [Myxococcus virescens]|uniref:Late embryogenesis abundant protein n=1 Tax=Myxococcus virescens TaxID=83456 RepID=A0A511HFF3_9BACT|nr:hypothetical protein [Myxococcus virescens]GEL72277.1 hypothetical protein MVI01_40610 [Myxococcus virescens]SDD69797.1 hypothetical protein SAMN04488504_102316 [Myxococcus virescens]